MIWTSIKRFFKGRTAFVEKTGTAILTGEQREGGYYYIKSADLPGFTFLLTPEESGDIKQLSDALGPALSAYMRAHFEFERRKMTQKMHPRISFADSRGSSTGKTMNLIAELCN